MIEYFDEVDEHDQPTGRKITKEEAHTKGLVHRVAVVLVFRPNGKLLVQAHKAHGRKLDHSVGGHVSSGEDYLTAAKREMLEELGLELSLEKVDTVVLSPQHFKKWDPEIRHYFGVFKTSVPGDWQFAPNEEVDEILEMSVEEIVELMNEQPDKFLKGFLNSMGAYLKSINSPLNVIAYGKDWGKL